MTSASGGNVTSLANRKLSRECAVRAHVHGRVSVSSLLPVSRKPWVTSWPHHRLLPLSSGEIRVLPVKRIKVETAFFGCSGEHSLCGCRSQMLTRTSFLLVNNWFYTVEAGDNSPFSSLRRNCHTSFGQRGEGRRAACPAWTSPRCSPSPARRWSGCWDGSRETRRRSGPRKLWTLWSKSWKRRRGPWRSWRGLSAARASPATAWRSPAPWMDGCRCLTGKACHTSFTAECGAGPTSSPTMSWRPWSAASTRSAPSRRTCASIPTTTNEWTVQVSTDGHNMMLTFSCTGKSFISGGSWQPDVLLQIKWSPCQRKTE